MVWPFAILTHAQRWPGVSYPPNQCKSLRGASTQLLPLAPRRAVPWKRTGHVGRTLLRGKDRRDGEPIVFVPGLKGCHLMEGEEDGSELRWLELRTLLGLAEPDLRLPLRWRRDPALAMRTERDIVEAFSLGARNSRSMLPRGGPRHRAFRALRQARDALKPGDVLEEVGLDLPWGMRLPLVQVYGPVLRALAARDRPVYRFCWDWRRELEEGRQELEDFCQRARRCHGGQQLQLVAHSMGGLLSYPLLVHRRPSWFRSAVLVSVPFGCGVGYLQDLHRGYQAGFMQPSVWAPEVVFSHPLSFIFFPVDDVCDGSVWDGETARPVPHTDFYDASFWEKLELSAFQSSSRAGGKPTRRELLDHLQVSLDKARDYRETWLQAPSEVKLQAGIPHLDVISGEGTPTLDQVVRKSSRSVGKASGLGIPGFWHWDVEGGAKVSGDGRIPLDRSVPPAGCPFTLHVSRARHMQLTNAESGHITKLLQRRLDSAE